MDEGRHILVIANETVAGHSLLEAIKAKADDDTRVTVLAPISHPREGYVIYEDTRRAAAGRRLDRTLDLLRAEGISAIGLVVDADPVAAVRDAVAKLEPTELIVSTHPKAQSGWVRRNVVEQIRRVAAPLPVDHVVVDLNREAGHANVLVIANETLLGETLIERIKARADESQASFLVVAPQGESADSYDEAERRLRRAIAELRGAGVDAHGQISHPDPYTAAQHAIRDERVDELIVSTHPGERSGWLRRDLVGRLRKDTGLPVAHVVAEPAKVGV